MNDDELVAKWKGWLEIVVSDLGRILLRRRLFEDTLKMHDENARLQEEGAAFFWFFSGLYVDSVVSGIRRQVKDGDDSISLTRLLREFSESPAVLSRARYHDLYEAAGHRVDGRVDQEFDQFAGVGGSQFDPSVARADLSLLKKECLSAEGYADRRVAHWDVRPPKEDLTRERVSAALETLESLVRKYFLLLHASALQVEPVLQSRFWSAFTFAWRPLSGEVR